MARALEKPGSDPSYLDYFGLQRAPFARLSRPAELFLTEQHAMLLAHLAGATEQSDSLVVICGADGSGKTSLLDRYVASLNDDICFACIDQTCNGEKQFYCAILRQLGFGDITGKPDELRHIVQEFLVQRGMAGDSVLLVIDNAHLINPKVLEQLCWVSAIKVNDTRVLSVVLAGNSDLVRIMDSPAMSQIEFNRHIRFNIRSYTENETTSYVSHRLKLAGGTDVVTFTNMAHPLVQRYTGGIPRLINILCNALLTEAQALDSHTITEDLLRTVADDMRLLPHVVPLQAKGRRSTDPGFNLAQAESQIAVDPGDGDQEGSVPKAESQPAERPGHESPQVDVKNLLEQISWLSEKLGKLKADRKRTLEDIGARDTEVSELHELLNSQTAESEKLASALGDSTAEVERLNQALTDNSQALQLSEQESTKLAEALENEKTAAKSSLTELADANALAGELGTLHSELQATSDVTAKAEREIERLESELSEATQANKALAAETQELAAIQLELKTTSEAVVEAERDIGRLESELSEATQANKTLTAETQELGAVQSELQTISELVARSEREIEHLKGELDAATEANDAMMSETQELGTLQSDLQAASAAVAKSEREIERLERQLSAATEINNALTAESDELLALESELQTAAAAVVKSEQEIESLEGQLGIATEDKNALAADLELAGQRLNDMEILEKNTADLKNEIDEKTRMLQTLQRDLDTRGKDLGDLQVLLEDSQQECTSLTARAAAAESRVEEAHADRNARIEAIKAFEVSRHGKTEQVMKVAEGQRRIMIGRGEDSELWLDSNFVSRHHALIFLTDEGLYIEDLNSLNGTMVNSEPITRCELRASDVITIGDLCITPRPA